MRRLALLIALAALFVSSGPLGPSRSWAEALDASEWTTRAPVSVPAISKDSLVEATLPPALLDAAAADAIDLRVVDVESGEEVPRLISDDRPTVDRRPLTARIFNRVFARGVSTTVTVDFEKSLMKNRLVIDTAGFDFRRRLKVEGASDGQTWSTIADFLYLYRVRHPENGSILFNKAEVALPDNDFRYLRLTVLNGQDDPGTIRIESVQAFHEVRNDPPMDQRDAVIASVGEDDKRHQTVVELDLGMRHLPVERIELTVDTANFYRAVRVESRDEIALPVRTTREDGSVVTGEREAPWNPVTSAIIYRFGEGAHVEERTSIDWPTAGARYARIFIGNLSDAPLTITAARVIYRQPKMRFLARPERRYALLVGNAKAAAPVYDLVHYVHIYTEHVTGTVGECAANPAFGREREPEVAWQRYAVFAALAAAAVVLAAMLRRQYKVIAEAERKG